MPALRDEIVRRVLEKATSPSESSGSASEQLNQAFAAIQENHAQADILHSMLDGVARFCSRAALFVLRGSAATGWQARGLAHNDAIRTISLNVGAGLVARAVQTRGPVPGAAADFDAQFNSSFGASADGNGLVIPLIVRGKVAAVVYADAGAQPGGSVDLPATELLVRAAAAWIEVSATRKPGSASASDTPPPTAKSAAAAAAVAAPARPAAPQVMAPPAPPVQPVPMRTVQPAPTPPPRAVPASAMPARSPEQEEAHRKAKRFAKLLVEEIKLYNQAKVVEGRKNKDLYNRLKDDIDKSRASYDKRYGQGAAASTDYFKEELIRILAEGDPVLLGSSFPR